MDSLARNPISRRRRWPLDVAGYSHQRSRTARCARIMEGDQVAHAALLHTLSAAAGRDDRHLRLAGPISLLRILGALAGSDGVTHRDFRQDRKPPPRSY